MKRTLDLADTCLQGLEHVRLCMEEGRFEDGIIMLNDTVQGYFQMEKSISLLIARLPDNNIALSGEDLRKALNTLISEQEKGNRGKVLEQMQLSLLPAYKKWQAELNKSLSPYVAS